MRIRDWRKRWNQSIKGLIPVSRVSDLGTSYVLWVGPSALDSTPIMVVATCAGGRPSENGKTGDMIQVAIMRRDMSPGDTYKSGNDGAICPSDCTHISEPRGGLGTCYVNKGRLRTSWERARDLADRGEVGHRAGLFVGAYVRLGMDGDPCAAPFEVWDRIARESAGWTGYTANWRNLDARWSRLFMASVQTPADAIRARSRGWRVFMSSMTPTDDAPPGLKECHADAHGLTCLTCRVCDGTEGGHARPSIWLRAHGSKGEQARKRRS